MHKREGERSASGELFAGIITGSAVTVGVTALLTAAVGFAISRTAEQSGGIFAVCYVLLALGSLAGGFSSARRIRKRGVVLGLLAGIPAAIIITAVACTLRGEISPISLLIPAFVILFSGVGGIIAANLPKRR